MSFLNFRDMIDGGGAGQAGDTFQGGLLSGLLNNLGIKPRGYWDRQGLLAPQPMPQPIGQPMPPQGITTTPLAPAISEDEIRALMEYLAKTRDPRFVGPQ